MHGKLTINDFETVLSSIWKNLLNLSEIDLDDNFFEVGGDSLLAIRLISIIEIELKTRVSLRNLFLYPTIASLSSFMISLKETDNKNDLKLPVRPVQIPLSFSQERLWFIDQFEGSVQYHIPLVYSFNGQLNQHKLETSFNEIIKRHTVLRSVIRQDNNGIPFQEVIENYHFKINVISQNKEENTDDVVHQLIAQPFDLAADLMIRVNLLQISPKTELLIIVMHHIAFDGWSAGILLNELMSLFNGLKQETVYLKQLDNQYSDYAIWQSENITNSIWEKKLDYWQQKLSGISPLLLPIDFARPAVLKTDGGVASFYLDSVITGKLRDLSKQYDVTLFMTMLSAFNVFLYHYTSQDDIAVGVPVSNRPQKAFEELIGMFVNTIVLRNKINADQLFTELLTQVKETTLDGYENQDVPLEKIVGTVVKERDLSRTPLFQVMFSFNNTPSSEKLQLDNIIGELYNLKLLKSQFELTLSVRDLKDELYCSFQYNSSLFSAETISRMQGHFIRLVQSIIDSPTQPVHSIPLIDANEINTLTRLFNNTAYPYNKNERLTTFFRKQCALTPHATAVIFKDQNFTYKYIEERSNQLAHFLVKQSVKPGMLVPVLIERDLNLLIAIWAVLKCGAAYVPIDPAYPDERIKTILTDIEANVLISSSKVKINIDNKQLKIIFVDKLEKQLDTEDILPLKEKYTDGNVAYIVYTSGSTGKPKGVSIDHNQALNFILGLNGHVNFKGRKIYSITTVSFDIFVIESMLPLCLGGTVILGTEEDQHDPVNAVKDILKHNADIFNCTPSRMRFLLDSGDKMFLRSLSDILFGGEAFSADLFNELRLDFKGKIYNLYGPTETTVYATIKEIQTPEKINVGKPFYNVKIYVLNAQLGIQPIGVYGEICIAGDGVSKGYLGLDALTNEKFVYSSDIPDERMYRTGDIGRWLPNGELEVAGRNDDQLKIRGFRIEPGEITNTIIKSGLVKRAYVTSMKDNDGNNTLVCYVVANDNYERNAVIDYLKHHLPEYMVPHIWVELDQLPLTINGKVNKKQLPAPEQTISIADFKLPETATENILTEIWEEILGKKNISINDNFFAIGGHSLFAVRVIALIKKRMNITIPVRMVFQLPTVYLMGQSVDLLAFNEKEMENYKVFKI